MRRATAGFALALVSMMLLAGLPLDPAPEARALVPGVVPVDAIALQQVYSGLSSPVGIYNAGDGSGRLFILQQGGIVRYTLGGVLQADAWLNVASKISCCGERGLLGMAFYPDFETSGRLIISYTRAGDGASVLERLTVPSPGAKPPTSGTILLVQSQPFSNHNGGGVNFGPDGYLYFGLGDGGSGGDPQNNGQNKNVLLGKMLRLDVSGPAGYTIPPDNPYANGGGRPEIWNIGLRNPWRWSFDRLTGDLWIGDVGQNLWEEVNFQPAGTGAGRNYGWRGWEAHHAYNPSQALQELSDPNLVFPVTEYGHDEGCSVTGGYAYRGPGLPNLQGKFLYSDYCSGTIWAAVGLPLPRLPALPPLPAPTPVPLPLPGTAAPVFVHTLLLDTNFSIVSFGEDEAGNVYVAHYGGSIHRIVPA